VAADDGEHDPVVIRLPDRGNGKVVVTGAPGVRAQYANDFIISDWMLARGCAFASTDAGEPTVALRRRVDWEGRCSGPPGRTS
jgi:hypothetical protein